MKKLFLFVVLLAALTVTGYFYLREREVVVTLSEKDLQERIEAAFPVEKSYLFVLTLRLSEPRVALVEGSDRIHYRMRATLAVPGREFSGTGQVSGNVRYDATSREIFLDRMRVEELAIEAVPAEYRGPLRDAADLVAGEVFEGRPLYTLDETFLDRFSGAVMVRDVRVADGKVEIAFGLAEPSALRWPFDRSGD